MNEGFLKLKENTETFFWFLTIMLGISLFFQNQQAITVITFMILTMIIIYIIAGNSGKEK